MGISGSSGTTGCATRTVVWGDQPLHAVNVHRSSKCLPGKGLRNTDSKTEMPDGQGLRRTWNSLAADGTLALQKQAAQCKQPPNPQTMR